MCVIPLVYMVCQNRFVICSTWIKTVDICNCFIWFETGVIPVPHRSKQLTNLFYRAKTGVISFLYGLKKVC